MWSQRGKLDSSACGWLSRTLAEGQKEKGQLWACQCAVWKGTTCRWCLSNCCLCYCRCRYCFCFHCCFCYCCYCSIGNGARVHCTDSYPYWSLLTTLSCPKYKMFVKKCWIACTTASTYQAFSTWRSASECAWLIIRTTKTVKALSCLSLRLQACNQNYFSFCCPVQHYACQRAQSFLFSLTSYLTVVVELISTHPSEVFTESPYFSLSPGMLEELLPSHCVRWCAELSLFTLMWLRLSPLLQHFTDL